jgi:hypothetical protein
MTTCKTITNDALTLLNLNNGILPVDPRHQERAFTTLVDLLKALRGDNVFLVRQIPANVNADLREQPWATKGLKEMVAREVAPFLQAKIPPTLGDEGERILRNAARQPIGCSLPDTLPRGSGNAWYGTYSAWCWTFYSGFDWSDFGYYGQVNRGESDTYYADFDGDAVLRGTSVATVAWSVEGGSVAISNQALSANLASAQLQFTTSGTQKVRARATYANGQVQDFLFSIEVVG